MSGDDTGFPLLLAFGWEWGITSAHRYLIWPRGWLAFLMSVLVPWPLSHQPRPIHCL